MPEAIRSRVFSKYLGLADFLALFVCEKRPQVSYPLTKKDVEVSKIQYLPFIKDKIFNFAPSFVLSKKEKNQIILFAGKRKLFWPNTKIKDYIKDFSMVSRIPSFLCVNFSVFPPGSSVYSDCFSINFSKF